MGWPVLGCCGLWRSYVDDLRFERSPYLAPGAADSRSIRKISIRDHVLKSALKLDRSRNNDKKWSQPSARSAHTTGSSEAIGYEYSVRVTYSTCAWVPDTIFFSAALNEAKLLWYSQTRVTFRLRILVASPKRDYTDNFDTDTSTTTHEMYIYNKKKSKKLKNISCEHDRLNGWN